MAAALLSVKTLAEFVAFSKDSKSGVLVGIPGAGSVSHIYGQLLQQKTVARLTLSHIAVMHRRASICSPAPLRRS
jgi:tripartite-type tricarboxylate transporter receptor subunit TctC